MLASVSWTDLSSDRLDVCWYWDESVRRLNPQSRVSSALEHENCHPFRGERLEVQWDARLLLAFARTKDSKCFATLNQSGR